MNKKQKRNQRQLELLKNFDGDFYQEKKIGDEWYIKMWNGGTKRWQVAVYSNLSYKKYKAFDTMKEESEDLDNQFNEKIAWERPTLENIKSKYEK